MTATAVLLVADVDKALAAMVAGCWKRENILLLL